MATVLCQQEQPLLAKNGSSALSPVPECAEADLSTSEDVTNSAGINDGHDSKLCENGISDAIFSESTNCEVEESVTKIADAVVVKPHETKGVYGDVLSHLITVPFEAQSMLKFHQAKESKDGKKRRRKPARKNTIPIFSQKQYLRGVGLMTLSNTDSAEEKAKKKSKTKKSSPKRSPILHSNRMEYAEFSPRSVKTLESPKRGDPQSPRKHDTTAADQLHSHLNSHLNQDLTAPQQQTLDQLQQHPLFTNNYQNIAALQQEHELQLQQHQLAMYYDPMHAVQHQLYHQMLMANYTFNPFAPYLQAGYQHIPPQPSFVNNPDHTNNVMAAAVVAAEAANQQAHYPHLYDQLTAYTNNSATSAAEAANQSTQLYHDTVPAPAPRVEDWDAATADLLARTKKAAPVASTSENEVSTTPVDQNQNPIHSNKNDTATLPVPSERSADKSDKSSGIVNIPTTKGIEKDKDWDAATADLLARTKKAAPVSSTTKNAVSATPVDQNQKPIHSNEKDIATLSVPSERSASSSVANVPTAKGSGKDKDWDAATTDLLARTKRAAPVSSTTKSAVSATPVDQNPIHSNKKDTATLPVPSERSADKNDKSNGVANIPTAKGIDKDEDATSKMEPERAAISFWPEEKPTTSPNATAKVEDNSEIPCSPGEKQKEQNSVNTVRVRKPTTSPNATAKVEDNSENSFSPGEKQKEQNSVKPAGRNFPPGWTISTHPRKTGRGFYTCFISPNNNKFHSEKIAKAFIGIQKELQKKNDGNEPSEADAMDVFDRRGHKR